MGLADLNVLTGVPVDFSVPHLRRPPRRDRPGLAGSSEDKSHEAVTAAVATVLTLGALRP